VSLLLDTSVLYSFLDPKDEHHDAGARVIRGALRGEFGRPFTSTFILDEAFTLLLARKQPPRRAERLRDLAWPQRDPFMDILDVTRKDVEEATELFLQHHERGLSFTDCTTIALARRHRVDHVATFDKGFHGLVPCVPK
jgi:uncharacterized protein